MPGLSWLKPDVRIRTWRHEEAKGWTTLWPEGTKFSRLWRAGCMRWVRGHLWRKWTIGLTQGCEPTAALKPAHKQPPNTFTALHAAANQFAARRHQQPTERQARDAQLWDIFKTRLAPEARAETAVSWLRDAVTLNSMIPIAGTVLLIDYYWRVYNTTVNVL